MLYKTHQRYGLLSGLLVIPACITLGSIPIITFGMRITDAILVMFIVTFSIIGALFGSEFPDCDSYGGKMANGEYKKGSVPSQKHPLISTIFRTFGVKHRGKFSHDYASLTFFFSIIYLLQYFGLNFLQNNLVSKGEPNLAKITNLIALGMIYFLSREIAMKVLFSKKFRKKQNFIFNSVITGSIFLGIFLITTTFGFTTLNFSNPISTLNTMVFLRSIMGVFVISVWVGAMSHLFADMMTNEGVHIFGKRLSPAKMVIRITEYPIVPVLFFAIIGGFIGKIQGIIVGVILGYVIYKFIKKTNLKTDSDYEDVCYTIVTILCVPALILLVISITGGDVASFLNILGL